MLNKLLVECIGTFFFISIVLNSLKVSTITPISIAIGLLAVIYFGGHVSGGYFNPATTIAMFLQNNMTFNLMIAYICSQIAGAGLAVKFSEIIV